MISTASLIDCGVAPTQARAFAEPIGAACREFGISGPRQVAAFVAQAMHESQGFASLEESLWYRDAARIAVVFRNAFIDAAEALPYVRQPERLANRAYANRLGNGPEASGDGWRYRGRGLFQITGRANYARAAATLGRPYLEQPELVAQPADAARTAGWYWSSRALSPIAERGDFDGVTRAINGPAMLGRAERASLYARALRALEGATA
ncbi:MAG: glycoside hydrolase family 19 protein [Burkholderiales bacterium]